MSGWRQDFSASARGLLRSSGFTAVAILTLGVGIGVVTGMFSIVYAVLLRPLPYPAAERLVKVWQTQELRERGPLKLTEATYLFYRDETTMLEDMGIYMVRSFNLAGDGPAERIVAAEMTPSLVEVLKATPQVGRLLREEDGAPGAARVVVLSHELWMRRFAGDRAVIGETVRIDGVEREVVGILPEGFGFPAGKPLVWLPKQILPEEPNASDFSYNCIARLRPGVAPEAATAELAALVKRLPERYPGEGYEGFIEAVGLSARALPLKDDLVGDLADTVWLMFGCSLAVLLIACANVVGLSFVRLEGRRREIALRAILGSGGAGLVRLYGAEGLLLGLGGGGIGVGLATVALRAGAAFGPAGLPRLREVGMGPFVLGFALAVSLGAGLLLTWFAALRTRRWSLVGALKEAAASVVSSRNRQRVRGLIVVGQLALAFLLLTACGLTVESFRRLHAVEPGFQSEGVLTARVTLDVADYPRAEQVAGFYARVLEQVRALPGVRAAGVADRLPLDRGGPASHHLLEDIELAPGEMPPSLLHRHVSEGYLEAMGIPLVVGRGFERADWEERRGVAVVNRALAERYWPGESPLGKRLRLAGEEPLWYTVVGVVGDAHFVSLETEVPPQVYYPLLGIREQNGDGPGEPWWIARDKSLVIRNDGNPLALAGPLRDVINGLDPNVSVSKVRTLADLVAAAGSRASFLMTMLSLAAVVGLFLGTLGLYGVVATAASQGTREVGLRMALGASRERVRGMFLRQGLRLSVMGILLGGFGSLMLAGWAEKRLYGIGSIEPGVLAATALLLLVVSLAAGYLPGHRAARLSPSEALRRD